MDFQTSLLLNEWGLSSCIKKFADSGITYHKFKRLKPIEICNLFCDNVVNLSAFFQKYKVFLDENKEENDSSEQGNNYDSRSSPLNESASTGNILGEKEREGSSVLEDQAAGPSSATIYEPPAKRYKTAAGQPQQFTSANCSSDEHVLLVVTDEQGTSFATEQEISSYAKQKTSSAVQQETSSAAQQGTSRDNTFALINVSEGVVKDVQSIIDSDAYAKLCSVWALKKPLEDGQRTYISKLILGRLLAENHTKKLDSTLLCSIRDAILFLFVHETSGRIWYEPYLKADVKSNIPKRSARGTLLSAYYSIKDMVKKVQTTSDSDKEIEVDSEPVESENEAEDVTLSIIWLENNLDDIPEASNHWSKTHDFRLQELGHSLKKKSKGTKVITLEAYLAKYQILLCPLGYNLVDIDFRLLFGEKTQLQIYYRLEEFVIIAVRELKKVKKPSAQLVQSLQLVEEKIKAKVDPREYAVHVLVHLAHLCNPFTVVRKGENQEEWRAGRAEMQDGFLAHVPDAGELHRFLTTYKKRKSKAKSTIEPIAVIVGPLNAISNCYVCLYDHKYAIKNPVKCLDMCFKSYYTLDTNYPAESQSLWLLLQLFIYDIPLTKDQKKKGNPMLKNTADLCDKFGIKLM